MTVAVDLSPGAVFAGYRIEELVARGGMGMIYRAVESRPERTVALKVVAPELAADDGFRSRFLRESQMAASIEHPHVVPVLRVGEEDGMLFIAMRFIPGRDLATLIGEEGRLEPIRAARIVDQVADALDSAHELGLVHRDVKPANVLVESRRRGEHVYLTDFGLTKTLAATGGLTATGMVIGTTDYMAPEQWEGARVDARVDVYSLGCVLYEALTARVPYLRESDAARMYAHLTAPPPSVSELLPGESRLDAVVARALAKTPSERYPSAGDLSGAALAAAEGRSVDRVERSVATGKAAPAGLTTVQMRRPAAGDTTRRAAVPIKPASTLATPPQMRSAAHPTTGRAAARTRAASATVSPAPRPPRKTRSGNPLVLILLAVVAAVGITVGILALLGVFSHQLAATPRVATPASSTTPRKKTARVAHKVTRHAAPPTTSSAGPTSNATGQSSASSAPVAQPSSSKASDSASPSSSNSPSPSSSGQTASSQTGGCSGASQTVCLRRGPGDGGGPCPPGTVPNADGGVVCVKRP